MSKDNKVTVNPLMIAMNHIAEERWDTTKFLKGKILTIIDASIADPEQRKGMKDLVKGVFMGDYMERERWSNVRIRRMLYEFNVKYSKLDMEDYTTEYFRDGKENYGEADVPGMSSTMNYFEQN